MHHGEGEEQVYESRLLPQRPSGPAITRWAATHVWMKEETNWILTQPLMGRWLTLVGWLPSSPASPRCASR